MKLTGKCKEDFEKWFEIEHATHDVIENFYGHRTPSMQYGVYVDFFREDCKIWIEIISATKDTHWIKILGEDIMTPFYEFEPVTEFEGSYTEAREKAIEKANDIYNQTKV